MHPEFLSELSWRNLIHQITDEPALRAHLGTGVRRGYIGFDPTADSLTVGNLVQIQMLSLFQRSGHVPVVVAGGGTGMIGDPSGKSAERQLMTVERVQANVRSQLRIFEKMLDFSSSCSNRAILTNNFDWLGKLSYIEALRDIGKFFSVNAMIQKDSVRDRLHNRDQGISYTEFSYMVLQAYDFLHLHRSLGVSLQMGGSDQWGNITAGTDLIRKASAAMNGDREPTGGDGPDVFGLTTPLLTKSDGGKFGKTESGAIWCTADRTSPFAFYQFWLNSDDKDIPKFLRTFTLFDRARVEELEASLAKDPGAREPHRALARHMTERLHGPTEAANAEAAGKALFSGEVGGLPADTLNEVFANVPSSRHAKSRLVGEGVALLDLLVDVQLAQSKREAKEFLSGGSVLVNGRRVGADERLKTGDLLHGQMIAIRRGKKNWHLTRWE